MNDKKIVEYILKSIGNESLENMELFISDISKRQYKDFSSNEDIELFFKEYLEQFYNNLTEEEKMELRTYTSYEFSNINNILRGNWSYEENGKLTEDIENKYRKIASNIQNIIGKLPSNLPSDIKLYRGTTLDSFKDYGISSLEELVNMKNQYYYDSGFTSTSLLKNQSFFGKNHGGTDYNIEIEYFIPNECRDGIALINDDLSHISSETEFLIDKSSLFKIVDVQIDEENKVAHLKMAFLPKKIYDPTYSNNQNKTM